MSIGKECSPKPRKVLIITSSGGGGLLQAANAKEQELKANDPNTVILQRDVMKDWMWTTFGQWMAGLWNGAQLRGSVKVQSLLGAGTPIADYIFWPYIFFYSLRTLFKEDIDQVIDTQIMGTSAVLKALRFFNRRRKKKVLLEKVLVDLPTKKATHFFSSIRSLSQKDRRLFRLITVRPLLEQGQTEAEFWKEHCNLTAAELQYENYYVRRSFVQYRNLARKSEPVTLRTRYRNEDELSLIQRALSLSLSKMTVKDGEAHFSVEPNERVFTILLGSQPANNATFSYVKKFMELSQELQQNQHRIYLFVFCANHEPGQDSLFRRVSEFIYENGKASPMLTVIPMSFQSDDVVAPLFFRSEMTCTRSGGQTAMELLSVSTGEIWIHSEAKKTKDPITNDELLKGIPGWESANAAYLQHAKNARIVTVDTFIPFARDLMIKQ